MSENERKKSNEDGFTLVEVMVTLLIIVLMGGIVAINVLPVLGDASVKTAKSNIRIFDQALEQYYADMRDYPEEQEGLAALKSLPSGADGARYRPGGYIKLLPSDPWGNPYVYVYPGENGVYDIISYGKDGEPGGEGQDADIVSWEE